MTDRQVVVGLSAAIAAVVGEHPVIFTVSSDTAIPALPAGPFDAQDDRTLEMSLRRRVRALLGIELGYVEQLYTFGDRFRDPRERTGGPRFLSIGYLALVNEVPKRTEITAIDWYRFLPWEDHRDQKRVTISPHIRTALDAWIASAESSEERERREDRAMRAFPANPAAWVAAAALERYELLYEAGYASDTEPHDDTHGLAMQLDHRRILATAMSRLRGKIEYRPLVFELMPETFTLRALQTTIEAIAGHSLHQQNFRRFIEVGGLVEKTGQMSRATGGRPAETYRFRRAALPEFAGIRLPGRRKAR